MMGDWEIGTAPTVVEFDSLTVSSAPEPMSGDYAMANLVTVPELQAKEHRSIKRNLPLANT